MGKAIALHCILAVLVLLAAPVVAQPSAPSPVGLVDQPCPPPLSAPNGLRALLETGGPEKTLQELASLYTPEVRDYMTAAAERAKTDWANLCYYRDQNAAQEGKPAPKAVFIGDSITEYWMMVDPAFFGTDILDRGISGQTSQQILARFYQDVVTLHPSVVHILAGTNDVAGNLGPSREQDVVNNIAAMADLARANRIRVIIGAIPPVAEFKWRRGLAPAAKIVALNAKLQALANQRGDTFLDYHAALSDRDGGMRSGLSPDGVHPNRNAYGLMEELAKSALARRQ